MLGQDEEEGGGEEGEGGGGGRGRGGFRQRTQVRSMGVR